MKGKYVGIYIDDNIITAVIMRIIKGVCRMEDAITMSRSKSSGEDISSLIHRYSLEEEKIAIVGKTQVYIHGEFSKLQTKEEVRSMLEWHIDEYIPWDRNTYEFDFFLRTIDDKPYVYIVAVNKNDTNELISGVTKGGGYIRIVDYYPAPLTYLYEKRTGLLLGIINGETNTIHFFAWWKGACVAECEVAIDEEVLWKRLEEIEDTLAMFEDTTIEGVQLYGKEQLSTEKAILCDSIIELYGSITPVDIEISDRAYELYKTGNLAWECAAGLCMRGLSYVNITQ